MKKTIIFIILANSVLACIEPLDEMVFSNDTLLCGSTYDIPGAITITGNNLVFDCKTSILRGISGRSSIGVRIENADNITLRNCNIVTFDQGIYLKNVTNSLIEESAFLKNRIGIRMLESYENIIKDNNDRSNQLAVSAISSKFNVVLLGNKNIERVFCDVNACNTFKDMNTCENDDFYCSKKCSAENDNDCGVQRTEQNITIEQELPVLTPEVQEELEEEYEEQKEKTAEKRELSTLTKIIIYFLSYCFALAMIKKR